MNVSILIKALNEEANIVRSVESALREIEALQEIDGEVILADSCSTDRTVELASPYPIRIVRFSNPQERSCGGGAQLAYQYATGDYVYLLDGDMALRPGFLAEALRYLDDNPDAAGVGGIVNEVMSAKGNIEMENRRLREIHLYSAGPVKTLDCGGLYRRSVLLKLGYFSDRNLHSYEELDLGARIRAVGGKLYRLDTVSVDHFHRDTGSYQLLINRLMSRYANGAGEILRGAIGKAHFRFVIRELRMLQVAAALLFWTLATVVVTAKAGILPGGVMLLLPFLVMAWRRRSIRSGVYSVVSWVVYTSAVCRGLLTPRKDPRSPIESEIISDRTAQTMPRQINA